MDEKKTINYTYIPLEIPSFLPRMCGQEAVDERMALGVSPLSFTQDSMPWNL